MEEISKYKAIDGSIFNTKEECLKYESIIKRVDLIMCPLGKRPDDTNFTNGGGYIQHDVYTIQKVKAEIMVLCMEVLKKNLDFQEIGYYLDGASKKCLYHAYIRLICIDIKCREWGQGYFAIHPDKGTQKPYHEIKKEKGFGGVNF